MGEFERLLAAERSSVERFVRFRLDSMADADDVLQEVFLAACQNFSKLKDSSCFKAWLIRIARNKCNDYFRKKASRPEIPLDNLAETDLADSRHGAPELSVVRETLHLLILDKNGGTILWRRFNRDD